MISRTLEIVISGVLGILVKAKNTHLIPEIRPMLERLLETNFRISSRIVTEVLKATGEYHL